MDNVNKLMCTTTRK